MNTEPIGLLTLLADLAQLILMVWVGRVGIQMARANQRITEQQREVCKDCGWFRIAVDAMASSTKPDKEST